MLALFTIILLGALATAMVFAAKAETRASASMLGASQSLSAAESAVWSGIAAYDWASALAFLPGQSARIAAGVYLVRLDSTCFFVQSTATATSNVAGTARFIRRVGVTIEITRDTTGAIRVQKVPDRAWTELF